MRHSENGRSQRRLTLEISVPAVNHREKRKYLRSGLGVRFAWHSIGAIGAYENNDDFLSFAKSATFGEGQAHAGSIIKVTSTVRYVCRYSQRQHL